MNNDLDIMPTREENQILAAIKEAIHRVNGGEKASPAIAKVASDYKFNPEVTRRMIETFNQSKTRALFQKAGFDRTSEFDIADDQEVLNTMFPKQVKSAGEQVADSQIPRDYLAPDKDFTKEAKTLPGIKAPEPAKTSRDSFVKAAYAHVLIRCLLYVRNKTSADAAVLDQQRPR